ncbi:MAG: S-layer homology domain-containing protein [Leptolyngbyaceae cyanobacterium CSU_1_3]|nr:S-layer homology domain-containing protein [Leptolyngbyaceae cyanobacterium CSU_1_3]
MKRWIAGVIGAVLVGFAEPTLARSIDEIMAETSLDSPPVPAMNAISDPLPSVAALSDIKPTDWAFQSLRSLVERYEAVVGYPDFTFRGDRALTRYEFAAGLNAALLKAEAIMQSEFSQYATQEDLEVLRKLQEEFIKELEIVRKLVDLPRLDTLRDLSFLTSPNSMVRSIFW